MCTSFYFGLNFILGSNVLVWSMNLRKTRAKPKCLDVWSAFISYKWLKGICIGTKHTRLRPNLHWAPCEEQPKINHTPHKNLNFFPVFYNTLQLWVECCTLILPICTSALKLKYSTFSEHVCGQATAQKVNKVSVKFSYMITSLRTPPTSPLALQRSIYFHSWRLSQFQMCASPYPAWTTP